MPATATTTLATTHGVRNRVHGCSSVVRAASFVTHTTGFTPTNILMIQIANLSDGRTTANMNTAHFATLEDENGIVAFPRHESANCAG